MNSLRSKITSLFSRQTNCEYRDREQLFVRCAQVFHSWLIVTKIIKSKTLNQFISSKFIIAVKHFRLFIINITIIAIIREFFAKYEKHLQNNEKVFYNSECFQSNDT